MAYSNKKIVNKITGQEIRFLQTAKDTHGKLLEMESVFSPFSTEPAPHFHPKQEEDFTVLQGSVNVRRGTEVDVFHAGESFHIPRKTVHAMWNSNSSKAVVNWKVQPALDTEVFFETALGLAADGKTNEKGMPNIFQLSLMCIKFSHVTRFVKPPYFVQKILFNLIAPFALLAGYKPTYKKYID